MNLEQTLTDELASVAGNLDVPPPPAISAVSRQADRARKRTALRSAATALLAAAVVLGVALWGGHVAGPNSAPLPTHRPTALPTGEPPRIPFIKNDRLYVHGQAQPGSWVSVLTRGGSSVGYVDDGNDLTQTVALFHDGSSLGRIPDVSVQGVLLAPDGSTAAWVQREGHDWFLVVYDLAAGHEKGRLRVGAHALGHVGGESEAWESLTSVDDSGTVRWGGVLAQHTWTPGEPPKDLPPAPRPSAPPAGDFPVDPDTVSISPDGVWGAWTVDHTGQQPQGTSQAPDQYDVELSAQKPGRPSTRIHFDLPRNSNASGIEWESTGAFLLEVFDDPTGISWHYLRCSIATRRCEVAPTPGAP